MGEVGFGGCPDRRQRTAVVLVNAVGLSLVADCQVQVAIVVPIAPGHAAGRLGVRGGIRQGEGRVLVGIDANRLPVVARRQVEVAIVVPVAPGHALGLIYLVRSPPHREAAPVVDKHRVSQIVPVIIVVPHGEVEVAIVVPVAPVKAAGTRGRGSRSQSQQAVVVLIDPDVSATAKGKVEVTVVVPVAPVDAEHAAAVLVDKEQRYQFLIPGMGNSGIQKQHCHQARHHAHATHHERVSLPPVRPIFIHDFLPQHHRSKLLLPQEPNPPGVRDSTKPSHSSIPLNSDNSTHPYKQDNRKQTKSQPIFN